MLAEEEKQGQRADLGQFAETGRRQRVDGALITPGGEGVERERDQGNWCKTGEWAVERLWGGLIRGETKCSCGREIP